MQGTGRRHLAKLGGRVEQEVTEAGGLGLLDEAAVCVRVIQGSQHTQKGLQRPAAFLPC